MIYVKSHHPSGTVAYISANRIRYNEFFDGIEQLRVPEGTALAKSILYNAARNRNEVAGMMKGEWILFLDDDHVWDPNLLLNLLDRNVDIVTPPYCRRYPPFETVAFSCYHPDKPFCKLNREEHVWTLHKWEDFNPPFAPTGLLEVESCGFGAVLVRKRVLESLETAFGRPFFRVGAYDPSWGLSSLVKDEMQEDLSFCWAARKAGFKVYLDLDQWLGHMTEVKLIATRDKVGKFRVMANIDGYSQWITQ